MVEQRGVVVVVIGAVLAVLLQIVVAPNIAFASVLPNIPAVYALAVAVVRPDLSNPILAFLLGLTFDLLGLGPVGAMAFLLVLATFLASRAYLALNNDTLFIPLFIMMGFLVIIEVLYGLLLLGTGMSVGLFEAFVYRVLPCALYDCVVALIVFLLTKRFLATSTQKQPGTTQLR